MHPRASGTRTVGCHTSSAGGTVRPTMEDRLGAGVMLFYMGTTDGGRCLAEIMRYPGNQAAIQKFQMRLRRRLRGDFYGPIRTIAFPMNHSYTSIQRDPAAFYGLLPTEYFDRHSYF